jgi:hypothetical protein
VSDAHAQRLSKTQRARALDALARDADRLARRSRSYADGVQSESRVSGGAFQLVQEAVDLLRQAARLDGMSDIGDLIE